jgi:hypothetical protein
MTTTVDCAAVGFTALSQASDIKFNQYFEITIVLIK